MKRMAMAVMFVAVAAIATAAFAWDMPTKVPTNTDDLKNVATSSALQNTLNEKLKNANCKFTPGTTKVTGCDLKKLGTELGAAYKVAAQQNYRVEVNISAADATAAASATRHERALAHLCESLDIPVLTHVAWLGSATASTAR